MSKIKNIKLKMLASTINYNGPLQFIAVDLNSIKSVRNLDDASENIQLLNKAIERIRNFVEEHYLVMEIGLFFEIFRSKFREIDEFLQKNERCEQDVLRILVNNLNKTRNEFRILKKNHLDESTSPIIQWENWEGHMDGTLNHVPDDRVIDLLFHEGNKSDNEGITVRKKIELSDTDEWDNWKEKNGGPFKIKNIKPTNGQTFSDAAYDAIYPLLARLLIENRPITYINRNYIIQYNPEDKIKFFSFHQLKRFFELVEKFMIDSGQNNIVTLLLPFDDISYLKKNGKITDIDKLMVDFIQTASDILKFQKLEIKIECFLGDQHSRDISNGIHALSIEKAFSPLYEYSLIKYDSSFSKYYIEHKEPKLDENNCYTLLKYDELAKKEQSIREKPNSKKFSMTISQGAVNDLEFVDKNREVLNNKNDFNKIFGTSI